VQLVLKVLALAQVHGRMSSAVFIYLGVGGRLIGAKHIWQTNCTL
jgi:hypothetical protein